VSTSYHSEEDSADDSNYVIPGYAGPQGLQGIPGISIRGENGDDGESMMMSLANQVVTPWRSFTATRTGWTDVGSPTVTASQCQIERVCYFQVKVVPATTVATVAGTSYIDLPITASGIGGDGSMQNTTTLIAVGNCVIDSTNSRVYVPTQAATANTLTVCGWYNV
jgi:hypothetical protein